jgi:hypothetical protein
VQNTGTALSSLNVVPYQHISNGKCQDVPLNRLKIHVTPSVVSNKKDLVMDGAKYLRGNFFSRNIMLKYAQKYLMFRMANRYGEPIFWNQWTQVSSMVLHFQTMNLTLLFAIYSVNGLC